MHRNGAVTGRQFYGFLIFQMLISLTESGEYITYSCRVLRHEAV